MQFPLLAQTFRFRFILRFCLYRFGLFEELGCFCACIGCCAFAIFKTFRRQSCRTKIILIKLFKRNTIPFGIFMRQRQRKRISIVLPCGYRFLRISERACKFSLCFVMFVTQFFKICSIFVVHNFEHSIMGRNLQVKSLSAMILLIIAGVLPNVARYFWVFSRTKW